MRQALIAGVIAVGIYGVFLMVRGLIQLGRYKQKKMLFWSLGVYIGIGALFALSLTIKYEDLNLWLVLPALVLGVLWLCLGYFMESYLRRERPRLQAGQPAVIAKRPPHVLRNNLIILLLALLMWVYGAVIGNFGGNDAVEKVLLCICLFLLARSCAKLWKYRGF